MLLRFLRTFVSRDPVILTMACVTVICVQPIFTICLVTSCVGKQPKQLDELLANWYIYTKRINGLFVYNHANRSWISDGSSACDIVICYNSW